MKTVLRIAFIMAFVLSIGAAAFAQHYKQTNLVSRMPQHSTCFFPKVRKMVKVRGIPHLAKNERDTPNFLHVALDKTACAPFFEERRMRFAEPIKPHRKSGIWGTPRFVEGRKIGWATGILLQPDFPIPSRTFDCLRRCSATDFARRG